MSFLCCGVKYSKNDPETYWCIDTYLINKRTGKEIVDVLGDSSTQEVKVGSMRTFTLKQTNSYADVDISENVIKKRKLVGVELTGEFTKFKVDNSFVNIFEQYKNGVQPDISIIGKAFNNNTGRVQRVKVYGVTFDELNLIDLQQKTPTEESLPYGAENYEWLENT